MNFREQLHKARYGSMCNFGGKSDSSSSSSTTNADQRLDVSSGAGATASSGGTVTMNVTQLDGGAISAAFGLGHDALADVTSIGTASMSNSAATAQAAINGILSDVAGTRQAYADATNQAISAAQTSAQNTVSAVTSAYQDAKTGDQKTLLIGALVVCGLAVSMPFLLREAK
jgi:hypothetical protein